jgi:hypothetical protein
MKKCPYHIQNYCDVNCCVTYQYGYRIVCGLVTIDEVNDSDNEAIEE